jgi:histidinol-phosphate phosphatase family protein
MKIIFLDRDGVINGDVSTSISKEDRLRGFANYVLKPEQLQLIEGSDKAIKRLNQKGYYIIVVTNQSCIAKRLITRYDLTYIHIELRLMLSKINAVIDEIRYCPHYPKYSDPTWDENLCVPCPCRKPGTFLFDMAAKKHGIELRHCVFIGDSTSDFLTAKNAGMTSIGVKTGFAGQDGKYDIEPDHWATNLEEAVGKYT